MVLGTALNTDGPVMSRLEFDSLLSRQTIG